MSKFQVFIFYILIYFYVFLNISVISKKKLLIIFNKINDQNIKILINLKKMKIYLFIIKISNKDIKYIKYNNTIYDPFSKLIKANKLNLIELKKFKTI